METRLLNSDLGCVASARKHQDVHTEEISVSSRELVASASAVDSVVLSRLAGGMCSEAFDDDASVGSGRHLSSTFAKEPKHVVIENVPVEMSNRWYICSGSLLDFCSCCRPRVV